MRCLKYLISKTRCPGLLDEPDKYGRTPLHYLRGKPSHRSLQIYNLLIRAGAFKNARDNEGECVSRNTLGAIDIEEISSESENSEKLIDSLLMMRAIEDEEIENIIHEARGEPIRKFAGSKSVLFRAVSKHGLKVTEALLESGHDPWTANTDDSLIPLHAALEIGHWEKVHLLLKEMKRKNHVDVLDLTRMTFSLMQKVFCNYQVDDEGKPHVSYTRCLKALLHDKILLDPLQFNSQGLTIHDLLQYLNHKELNSNIEDHFPLLEAENKEGKGKYFNEMCSFCIYLWLPS